MRAAGDTRTGDAMADPGAQTRVGAGTTVDPRTGETRVLQGGRAKAYRPLPEGERSRALEAGLEAYDRGDHFLAHELLEPAWMGTDDAAERDLYQGLIKLAAGYVHAARGNAAGTVNNLRGARERLARVPEAEAARRGVAMAPLLAGLDRALEVADDLVIEQRAGSPEQGRRRPLDLPAPPVRGESRSARTAATRASAGAARRHEE